MIWKKYIKIRALGTDETDGIFDGKIVVQEKVDGANFSFFLDDDKLIFASRNMVMIDKKNAGNWKAMFPVTEAFNQHKDKFNPNYLYVGESTQKHTISYDLIPGFIGYDIWDEETELFLDWKDTKEIFESLGLEFIHIHFEKDGNKITIEKLQECIKDSAYKDGPAEGVVIKNYNKLDGHDRQIFAKIVTDEFKESNRKAFGGTDQPKRRIIPLY